MNERDKLIKKLIKEKGGSRKDYLNLLDSIAYHESAHTMNPKIKQYGGGPGRGKYQFEEGKNAGGITAAKRTKKYYKEQGIPVPDWLKTAASGNTLDATKLSSEQQDILFLGNMKGHPKADFKKVWNGEQTVSDFWANYHWAGADKDRATRLKSFGKSQKMLRASKGLPEEMEATKTKDATAVDAPHLKQGVTERNIGTILSEDTARGIMGKRPLVKPLESRMKPQPIVQKGISSNFAPSDGDAINAPISETGHMDNLINYMKQFSMGGAMNSNNIDKALNSFNVGGTHGANPNGGIPQGVGDNGKLNTVEQGETSFMMKDGKYIFSNRLSLGGSLKVPNLGTNAFAEGGHISTDPLKKTSTKPSDTTKPTTVIETTKEETPKTETSVPNLTKTSSKNRTAWKDRYGSDTHYFRGYLDKADPATGRKVKDIISDVSKKTGVDPNLLYTTAMAEGLDNYNFEPYPSGYVNEYPVSGIGHLGLDTIFDKKDALIKGGYLKPEYFDEIRAKDFNNEKSEDVTSADFKDLDQGLEGVAAFLNHSNDRLDSWSKRKGINLTDRQRQFFQNVAYNAGQGNARKMIESYKRQGFLKDEKFISEQPTKSWSQIHKHMNRRVGAQIGLDEQNILNFSKPIKRQQIEEINTMKSAPAVDFDIDSFIIQ